MRRWKRRQQQIGLSKRYARRLPRTVSATNSTNGVGKRICPTAQRMEFAKQLLLRWRWLGATPHQIMVITGHQTLEEVERYIALNACVICIPKN
jgi:hypothetical protein